MPRAPPAVFLDSVCSGRVAAGAPARRSPGREGLRLRVSAGFGPASPTAGVLIGVRRGTLLPADPGAAATRDPVGRVDGQVSFSRISSRTRPASAWPRISFMTAPISAPAAATLPSRILSATSGLAAIAASTAATGRRRRRRPPARGPRRSPRGALAGEHAVEHLAGQLVVDACPRRPAPGRRRPGRASRRGRRSRRPASLARRAELGEPPLAGRRGDAPAAMVSSIRPTRTGADDVAHLEVGEAPVGLQPGAACAAARAACRAAPRPTRGRRDRHQVGLGEVAVVLGVGLLAAATS